MNNRYRKNKYLRILIVFISILITVWGFMSALYLAQYIETPNQLWWVFSISIPTSFFIAMGSYIVMIRLEENLLHDRRTKSIIKDLHAIEDLAIEMANESSYFKLMHTQWRVECELKKARNVNGGISKIEALSSDDYIIYVFRSFMLKFKAGDVYRGVCNMSFWENVDFHRGGMFLSENIEAVKRGVEIHRIILVDAKILHDPSKVHEKNKLIEVIKKLKEWEREYKTEFEKMDFTFLFCENYEEVAVTPVPFALVTNQLYQEHMIIEQNFIRSNGSSSIDFFFSKDQNTPSYTSRIHKYNKLHNTASGHLSIREAYTYVIEHQ
ncbi:MAG: hypothetical protein AB8H47_18525 [Bacteroidia bacterium]